MVQSFECALWGNSKAHINKTSIVNMCTGIAIGNICNARDSNVYIMPDMFDYVVPV